MANPAIGGDRYKLQVFGGDKRINGYYVQALGKPGKTGVQLVVSVPVLPQPKPSPDDAITVVYVPGPKGGALRVAEGENEFVVLEGPTGRGFWSLRESANLQPGPGIGESVEGEKWVVQKNGPTSASFLGFNEDDFPGSGGWVASRLENGVVGAENYAISWLSPGTANIGLVEDPIPIRISLVRA